MKALAVSGEWMGCPAKLCKKGEMFVEARERCVLVSCPTCNGTGRIVLWQMVDKTRLAAERRVA